MMNAANKLMNYEIKLCTVAAMGNVNDGGNSNRQQPNKPKFRRFIHTITAKKKKHNGEPFVLAVHIQYFN